MDLQGLSSSASSVPVPPARSFVSPYPLRPLSTGEVLDRCFVLYRRGFWRFVSIGMLPAAAVTFSTAGRMVYMALSHTPLVARPQPGPGLIANSMSQAVLLQFYFLPATVLFVLAYGLSHAATVHAVQRAAQGVAVGGVEAYRAVGKRWLRWLGIVLRQFWSLVWPMLPVIAAVLAAFAIPGVRDSTPLSAAVSGIALLLVPASFAFGVINFLRNALAVPAGVEEDLAVNAAMRRSRTLAASRKGRIFLTLLLVYALQIVAGGLQLPFVWLATTSRGLQHIAMGAAELVLAFACTALVSPVASIALTLLYVDERVRREGYDIEVLMKQTFETAGYSAA